MSSNSVTFIAFCVCVCVCARVRVHIEVQKHELVSFTSFGCMYLQQSVNTECTVVILLVALITVVDTLCIA